MRKRDKILVDTSLIAQQQIDLVDLTVTGSERETHVSIKGNLTFQNLIASPGALGMAFVHIRKGHSVLALSLVNDTEMYPSTQDLLWGVIINKGGAVDTEELHYIDLDVGAKRKMRPGDKIAFIYKSAADAGYQLGGHFAPFAMED